MSYQVLARKWRPRNFGELVGQEHVAKALINALDNDRLHHAFLFTGTRGVGKTTIARILAKSLNCDNGVTSQPCGECSACTEINEGRFVDLIEVDAASRTKVDETRELLDNVQYAPTRGRYKVYLIDEVHMFSNSSFNALLKTLEEPPPHVKFLLATTDPQKLPVTILSRCLQFNLKRLPQDQIREYLARVMEQEGIVFDNAALALIARAADGSMRDALSLLDQAIAYGSGALNEADVRTMLGAIEQTHIIDLLQLLADQDGPAVLTRVAQLAEHTPDFSGVLAEFISTLHRIALAQTSPDAIDDSLGDRDDILALAAKIPAEEIQLYYQIALIGRRDLPLAPEPRGGFEMILLRMLAFRPVDDMANRASDPAPTQAANPDTRQSAGPGARPTTNPDTHPAAKRESPVNAARAAARAAINGGSNRNQKRPEPSATAPTAPIAAPDPAPNTAVEPIEPAAPISAPTASAAMPSAPLLSSPPAQASAQDWESIVNALQLAGMNQQLALNCALLGHHNDQFELGIAAPHQQLLGKAREKALVDALSAYYGRPITVSFSRQETTGITPAQQQQTRREERQEDARCAIENDDAVQAFKKVFDAQVNGNTVQPVD